MNAKQSQNVDGSCRRLSVRNHLRWLPRRTPTAVTPRRFAILSILALSICWCLGVGAADWQEVKGDHFIVYYMQNEKFAKDTAHKAEQYYVSIADELGYPRYSNFWQWDNRVKIYIYPTQADYLKGSGEPAWSKGFARYKTKDILTYEWSDSFLEALLPHEITHLIFRDFVGFKGEIPLWMDEGVAQWQEPKKREAAKEIARYLLKNQKAFTFESLMQMDIRGSKNEEEVYNFYMQSVTIVDFMVKRYGAQSFTEFCRQLRDGKSLNEALRFAYPASGGNIENLEKEWKKVVMEE